MVDIGQDGCDFRFGKSARSGVHGAKIAPINEFGNATGAFTARLERKTAWNLLGVGGIIP
jgi:hypothetical protein